MNEKTTEKTTGETNLNSPRKRRATPPKPAPKANAAPVPSSDTLATLIHELEAKQSAPRRVSIDVSPFLTWPDGAPVVLEWQFPKVADMYRVETSAQIVARTHKLPIGLTRDVILMAACHQSPDPGDVTRAGQRIAGR